MRNRGRYTMPRKSRKGYTHFRIVHSACEPLGGRMRTQLTLRVLK